MEYLGGRNLLTSHFIIGCCEVERKFTLTETQEIEALHKWLDFKDNDWGMRQYRTERTQYIDFLEIIDFECFKNITTELYKSYSNEYPYATKKDFIKHVFEFTIYDLETFLKLKLSWLGEAPNEDIYSFYTVYSAYDREYLDYAINSNYTVEHYRQYYKVVLDYLKSFYDASPIDGLPTCQPIETEEETDQLENEQKKQSATLSDLITHQNSVKIVEGIKIKYKNIKGKRLKLLLLAFQDLDLLPKERLAQKFYDCCKKEFEWDIASYNAMNGYNFNNVIDNEVCSKMKEYLKTLI
jgi:hypothetical protein